MCTYIHPAIKYLYAHIHFVLVNVNTSCIAYCSTVLCKYILYCKPCLYTLQYRIMYMHSALQCTYTLRAVQVYSPCSTCLCVQDNEYYEVWRKTCTDDRCNIMDPRWVQQYNSYKQNNLNIGQYDDEMK